MLDEQIGQMINIGFSGDSPDNPGVKNVLTQIKHGEIGGVTLFSATAAKFTRANHHSPCVIGGTNDNIKTPERIKTLIASLKAQAIKYPLFVCVDQEGGLVQRLNLRNGFPNFKTAAWTADNASQQQAYDMYCQMSKILADIGINFNFAPVVDIRRDYKSPAITKKRRSFGKDAETVIKFAKQVIKASDAYGIATSLKHFPGHGSAKADSHLGFVDVTNTWERDELIPYKTLIAEGLTKSVMVAHVFNKNLDEHLPASLSKNIITGVLRRELEFDGVVISDDFHMGAIRNHYSLQETVVQAINAGTDILVFSNNLNFCDTELPQKIIAIVKQAVDAEQITVKQIEQSFERIMKLKKSVLK